MVRLILIFCFFITFFHLTTQSPLGAAETNEQEGQMENDEYNEISRQIFCTEDEECSVACGSRGKVSLCERETGMCMCSNSKEISIRCRKLDQEQDARACEVKCQTSPGICYTMFGYYCSCFKQIQKTSN